MTFLSRLAAPFAATLVVLTVACSGGSGDGDPAAAGVPGAGAVPPQSQGAAQAPAGTTLSFVSLATTLQAMDSFRFDLSLTMDADLPDGENEHGMAAAILLAMLSDVQVEGAFVSPDRFEVDADFSGTEVQVVQIGQQRWANLGSGWQESAGIVGLSLDFNSLPAMLLDLVPTAELAGAETAAETIDGVQTTRYSFDKASLSAFAAELTEKAGFEKLQEFETLDLDVWLTGDGVPVRATLDLDGRRDDARVTLQAELNITDLNDPAITIEQPN